jgi:hypothetical protein
MAKDKTRKEIAAGLAGLVLVSGLSLGIASGYVSKCSQYLKGGFVHKVEDIQGKYLRKRQELRWEDRKESPYLTYARSLFE